MVKSAVKVFVRFRPSGIPPDGVEVLPDGKSVIVEVRKKESSGVVNNNRERLSFKFDGIIQNTSQEAVFTECAEDVVSRVLNGYNGTIFAYGQTGSGKTYTMVGENMIFHLRGIIPRSLHYVFREIDLRTDREVIVRVSYLEIYGEVLCDLLSDDPASGENLAIVEQAGVTKVKGLTKRIARSEEEALTYFFEGEANRSVGPHILNETSSRSHCIFTIHLECKLNDHPSEKVTVSKLNLVDLAGSERVKKTMTSGDMLKEAMTINKSLTFLEQAVNALSKGHSHVSFRQTKLTAVLKDALGGNCRTVMIACAWTETPYLEETMTTLKFAQRVRALTTYAVVNEKSDPATMIRRYERQIADLKQELAMRDTLTGRGRIPYDDPTDVERHELGNKIRAYLNGEANVDIVPIETLKQIKECFRQFREAHVLLLADLKKEVAERRASVTETEGLSGSPTEGGQAAGEESGGESLVGEVDPDPKLGIDVGQAPANARPSQPDGSADPLHPSSGDDNQTSAAENKDDRDSAAWETETARKNVFLTQYKKHVPDGKTLDETLKNCLVKLREKRHAIKEIINSVNQSKRSIDELRESLDAKREERLNNRTPRTVEAEMIDEEEFEMAKKLKALKVSYRQGFNVIKTLRAELQTLAEEAAECRNNLVVGFNTWYEAQRSAVKSEQPGQEDASSPEDNIHGDPSSNLLPEQLVLQRMNHDDPEMAVFEAAKKLMSRNMRRGGLSSSYQNEKMRFGARTRYH
ncbi:hypothetical protein CBR_g16055 [Chara braunii]|uniref:Kinesin-like protein n=1 Tax=Chara braunii TaxID=69332 RepID=A0A388JT46_CHABU|nr:hypothetical protein CBR_g16055 [Chara braunii]|eukprot:GBG60933.1 hypothetical protein CBR_g16055 [Chara braunii]